MSASLVSFAGLIDSKYFPDAGGTNSPFMKSSYRDFIFGSALSGAGSNSHRSPKTSSGARLPRAVAAGRLFGRSLRDTDRLFSESVGGMVACTGMVVLFNNSQRLR